ncbi:MAG: hypothetical protein ACODAC_11385 [Pseudomonadota bacterium]
MEEREQDADREQDEQESAADTGTFYWALKSALERGAPELPLASG